VASSEHSESGFNIHPMEQFEVRPLFGGDHVNVFTFTNSTLWMVIVVAAVSLFLILSMRGRALVPTRSQSMAELLYGFVRQMVADVAGEEGLKFFPYIFTLFTFILFSNLLGLVPYSFTVTSHIAVTATLALAVFVSVTAIGFIKHGPHFLSFFWPKDAPGALRPVLCIIELISYFVRPVSHSIRLGANMMAGHAVLKVFAGFVAALGVLGAIPIAAMVGIYALELLVAIIQAYVFAILTVVYLNDALHMH